MEPTVTIGYKAESSARIGYKSDQAESSARIGYKSDQAESSLEYKEKIVMICLRVPFGGPFCDKSPLPKLDVVYDGVDFHLFAADEKRTKLPPMKKFIESIQNGVPYREEFIATKEYQEDEEKHEVLIPIEEPTDEEKQEVPPPYLYYHEVHSDRGPHAYFSELNSYAVVYKESTEELFFIGGYRCPLLFKKEVWICNMGKRTWYQCSSMKRCRVAPTAFHFNNNIYVFGSRRAHFDSSELVTTASNFGEFYDSADETWHYLPPVPTEIVNLSIISHALDDKTGKVYFWFTKIGAAYYYNINTKKWFSFHPVDVLDGQVCATTFHPQFGIRWNNSTVFLDSFVVWFYFGTIYGYEINKQLFLSLCTLPEPYKSQIGTNYDSNFDQPRSYLVKVGDGKLSLVYEGEIAEKYKTLYCHTFSVQYIPLPHIEHQGCHNLRFKGFEVESVHAINPCKEQMKKKIFKISREHDHEEVPEDVKQLFLRMLVEGPYPEQE